MPVILAIAALLHLTTPVWSQRLFLPEDLQLGVNQAIDAGVRFLKATQFPMGTWTVKNHESGYAALPGLTLLECGESPVSPAVQQAARFVRWKAPKMEATYELALSILFLDRIGDPQDSVLIQTLAMRLVAGQTATGGWNYKCPILPVPIHKELLTLLIKLGPPVLFDPLGRDAPLLAQMPIAPVLKHPGLNNPLLRPDGVLDILNPIKKPGDVPAIGINPLSPGNDSLLPPQRPDLSEPGLIGPKIDVPQAQDDGPRPHAFFTSRKGWCIKMLDGLVLPAEEAKRPAAAAKPKPLKIPAHLNNVAVLHDPAVLPFVDPEGKATDNSNSQFAMLALWAARRHGIPMTRTLNLISRRFHTSQKENGRWGYKYRFGGGDEKGSPAMTCVGLVGLAIAHGLAVEHGAKPQKPAKKAAPDPRIVLGFLALAPDIGEPTGQRKNLPMTNLYFLWSVERLAVLFNLPTIAKKDWYGWGAEILVANQKPEGCWEHKKGYPGADRTVDTCLALLFLNRANLMRDLPKFPFNPIDLSESITPRLPATPEVTLVEEPKSAVKLEPAPPSIKPANPHHAQGIAKDNNLLASAPAPAPVVAPVREAKSNVWLWVLGIFGVLALLSLLSGVIMLCRRNGQADADEEGPPRKSRRRKSSQGV